jgi:hypothetical protein
MSAAVRREERRLRRIFQRALWIAAAAPAALPLACGAQEGAERGGSGGGTSGSSSAASSTGAAMESGTGGAGDLGSGGSDAGGEGDGGLAVDGTPDVPGPADAADFDGQAGCTPVKFTPNPPDTCGNYVRLPCGLPAGVTPAANCFLWLNDCAKVCPGLYFNCHAVDDSCKNGVVVPGPTGAIDIDCATCAKGVGRVPAGLARARIARAPSALGDHFAVMAHLEAASVHAFRRLHRELVVHGAPARLLRAARRARRDEVRHAQRTSRMARRFGGDPVRPRVSSLEARALDAVAIENAVEGCVRETFGALQASFQAANAADAGIARLMRSIARDETRHAALSWAVARWASRRLDAAAREALAARCREAVEALRGGAESGVPPELAARAGLPDAAQHRALVAALEAELWERMSS